MFPEEFLHFIWQFQYFDSAELRTTDGQAILISKQGFLNSDAGPDFREARLRIGEMEWRYISRAATGTTTNTSLIKRMTVSFSMWFGRLIVRY